MRRLEAETVAMSGAPPVCPVAGKSGGQRGLGRGLGGQEGSPILLCLPASSSLSLFPRWVSVISLELCIPAYLSLSLCMSLSPGCLPPPAEKAKSHLEVPLEENVNRRVLEEGSVEARTIEDAIAVLR